MKRKIKTPVTASDLDAVAALAAGRGKTVKVPTDTLSRLLVMEQMGVDVE